MDSSLQEKEMEKSIQMENLFEQIGVSRTKKWKNLFKWKIHLNGKIHFFGVSKIGGKWIFPFLWAMGNGNFHFFRRRNHKRNGFSLVLQGFGRFGCPPGGQKKWNSIGFIRFSFVSKKSRSAKTSLYQCFSISFGRFGRTREPQNLVLLTVFHFF